MKRYYLPIFADETQPDRRCPHCGRWGSHAHQRRSRRVTDTRIERITTLRMHCSFCRRTWTVRPEGIAAGCSRSRRVQAANVLLYVLGLSYRGVAAFLTALGVPEGKSSVVRDMERAGQAARKAQASLEGHVKIAGIDGTGQRLAAPGNPHAEGLVCVVDFGSGCLLHVELTDETDTKALRRLITEMEARWGIGEWVSDEQATYGAALRQKRHSLCRAHFTKARRAAARELEKETRKSGDPRARLWRDLQVFRRAVKESPPEAEETLDWLIQRWQWARAPSPGGKATPEYRMKQLLMRTRKDWKRSRERTNNPTEQAIGRLLKARSKTMRGFKKPEKIVGFVSIAAWMDRQEGAVRMGVLVA